MALLRLLFSSFLVTLIFAGCTTISATPSDRVNFSVQATPEQIAHPVEEIDKSRQTAPDLKQPPLPEVSTSEALKNVDQHPKAKTHQVASYTVATNDTLWSIAMRAEVYDDPLLWPLIYQANRDQIKDPRQVHSGQVLTIPRNSSEAERDDARQKSRKSDIFPVRQ